MGSFSHSSTYGPYFDIGATVNTTQRHVIGGAWHRLRQPWAFPTTQEIDF